MIMVTIMIITMVMRMMVMVMMVTVTVTVTTTTITSQSQSQISSIIAMISIIRHYRGDMETVSTMLVKPSPNLSFISRASQIASFVAAWKDTHSTYSECIPICILFGVNTST